MNRNTNSDGSSYSEDRPGVKKDGAAPRDTLANSVGDSLPNVEPQAPQHISVESVDDGNRPYNPGGTPNGCHCRPVAGEP